MKSTIFHGWTPPSPATFPPWLLPPQLRYQLLRLAVLLARLALRPPREDLEGIGAAAQALLGGRGTTKAPGGAGFFSGKLEGFYRLYQTCLVILVFFGKITTLWHWKLWMKIWRSCIHPYPFLVILGFSGFPPVKSSKSTLWHPQNLALGSNFPISYLAGPMPASGMVISPDKSWKILGIVLYWLVGILICAPLGQQTCKRDFVKNLVRGTSLKICVPFPHGQGWSTWEHPGISHVVICFCIYLYNYSFSCFPKVYPKFNLLLLALAWVFSPHVLTVLLPLLLLSETSGILGGRSGNPWFFYHQIVYGRTGASTPWKFILTR